MCTPTKFMTIFVYYLAPLWLVFASGVFSLPSGRRAENSVGEVDFGSSSPPTAPDSPTGWDGPATTSSFLRESSGAEERTISQIY